MHALVLSGGGAKGAYEAGLICTLIDEFGESFDIISGTSIGAINAAFLAQDDTAVLANLWRTIARQQLISPIPHVLALHEIFTGFINGAQQSGLKKRLSLLKACFNAFNNLPRLNPLSTFYTLTGAMDPQHIQRLLDGKILLESVKHILLTTTTNLNAETADVFYYFPENFQQQQADFLAAEPGAIPYLAQNYTETIRASSAIPGVFSPVEIPVANRPVSYVDGGVINNTPIGQAIDAGATKVTVVYLDPVARHDPRTRGKISIASILLGCFSIMQQRILELDYNLALSVNDGVQSSAPDTIDKKNIELRTFRPRCPLAAEILDFDKQDLIDATYAQGQDDARNLELRNAWTT